jgi:hypothetical protein
MEMAVCMNDIELTTPEQLDEQRRHQRIVQRRQRSTESADSHAARRLRLRRPGYIGRVNDDIMPGFSQPLTQTLYVKLYATDMWGIEWCNLQDLQTITSASAVRTSQAYPKEIEDRATSVTFVQLVLVETGSGNPSTTSGAFHVTHGITSLPA